MSKTNPLLRQHLTRVGFDLSLGRTHIAALVEIHQATEQGRTFTYSRGRSPLSNFSTGAHGLIDRGLVTHRSYEREQELRLPDGKRIVSRYYKITRAGELVVGLLKESGLYDEYATSIRASAA